MSYMTYRQGDSDWPAEPTLGTAVLRQLLYESIRSDDLAVLLKLSAGGGDRTRTPLAGPRILSPVRLPVSPPRRIRYVTRRALDEVARSTRRAAVSPVPRSPSHAHLPAS